MSGQTRHMNGGTAGGRRGDSLDDDEDDYEREMRRPPEVREDVRQMQERSRVKLILRSRAFRDELEELVVEQMKTGGDGLSLQQLSELILPKARASIMATGAGSCIPIADIRDADTMDYEKGEKLFRCKLASLYRVVDLFGWSHGIQSYITGRISQDFERFLIVPYGMMFNEVTAASLVKVDMRGDVLDPGCTMLGVNRTAFSLHAAIYAVRPDVKCVLHVRNTPAVSVSALTCGLLPLCQEAMAVGDVSYYDYSGAYLDTEERDKLRRALGPINKVLILRNYGIVVLGETVEEALFLVRNVMSGVDTQLRSISVGLDNLHLASEEERRAAFEAANQPQTGDDGKKWRRGEMEFEALMRHLDNAGFRTGYIYRESAMRRLDKKDHTINSDVAVPPASSSMMSYDDDVTSRATPKKPKTAAKQKKAHKSDFLSTQKKDDLDETSTSALNATKTSKWAPEDTSTPIKPEHTVQSSKAPSGGKSKHRQDDTSAFDSSMRQDVTVTTVKQDRTVELNVSRGASGEPLATRMPTSPSDEQVSKQKSSRAETPSSRGDGRMSSQRSSPSKSASSVGDREGSPVKELSGESPSKDKKKKKVFHMPSFGSKKKEKH